MWILLVTIFSTPLNFPNQCMSMLCDMSNDESLTCDKRIHGLLEMLIVVSHARFDRELLEQQGTLRNDDLHKSVYRQFL